MIVTQEFSIFLKNLHLLKSMIIVLSLKLGQKVSARRV